MKKNAFTLIELIATIGLLGMLATITITVSVRKINETKEKARDTMIESIKLAAEKYVTDYESELTEFKNKDNIYISLQTLVEKEYFTESLVDPTTKKSIPITNEVYITRDENGEISSTYDINQRQNPKITLIGSYNEYVEEGKEYVEKGVNAITPSGEDASSNVTITGTVDTTIPNTYKITYQLDNTKITRNVIVFSKNIISEEYYKFTINLDGGVDNTDYEKKYKPGSSITLEEPTKKGYKFIGWNLKGKGANINGNVLITGPGIITITAIWEEVITTISFNEDDWATIVNAVQRGTYPYKVGDTKIIDLGDLGTHTIRVSNTTLCEGLDLSSQSACGFVLEFADIITIHDMNTLSTNFGSWPASAMRTYVNNTIYNALPNDLRNAVIDTYVVSGHGDGDSSGRLANNNFGSTDKLYLLSPKEVWGSDAGGSDTASGDNITRQLDWYNYNNVTSSSYSEAIKNIGTTPSDWWLRSPDSIIDIDFSVVTTLGGSSANAASGTAGVSPAFRLAQ